MKKIYLLLLPVLCLLWQCSENDHMVWESKQGVYFSEYTSKADSLTYSFRITGLERDTVQMEIKLQGAILTAPKSFRITAGKASTAVAGVHYEALKESYIFPVGQSTMLVPVVILKQGEELDDKTVSLVLSIEATDELDVALPDRSNARLLITNQLIKPYYWDFPLSFYFGSYSQVKHLKCIEIMEHDFPLKESELMGYGGISGYTYWMRAGRAVCNYYASHTEYDENGDLIATWEPL